GRAGASGQAVSLVSGEDRKLLKDIERLIKKPLERKEVTGFDASKAAPEPADDRPPRPPQRPRGGG
ncbi:MAG TPA: ATP-dependent RNA helicase, partial [Alcanivorax sp.]|nr:ATP-dependent RNA helicase [Alcanivorax sp.]